MGKIFAIAGKGGVGKSTISSLLVLYLSRKADQVILAVDADPNYNLGDKLGIEVKTTIGELRDKLQKAEDSGISKQEKTAYGLRMALEESEHFDIITMGHSEGKGCYCYINSLLRDYLSEIMNDYPYIVIDNEAGMEHISRLICKKMDILFIVSDDTPIGLKTAKRILELSQNLDVDIGRTVLIINRIMKNINKQIIPEGFSEVYSVPYDDAIKDVSENDYSLKLLTDCKAYQAVADMIDELLKYKHN